MSEHKVLAQALLARAVPGDRLVLADAVLLAALDGSRPLAPSERSALQGSPLTLRRFKHLALQRRAAPQAANDAQWFKSSGMLRAAADTAELEELVTDDGHWALHFVADGGPGWQLVLKLDAQAPFAQRLLRERPLLRVVDGGGAILLQGRLDDDGECERPWTSELAPMAHFQLYGATFAIEPCR
ncbi:hypothetical protein GCM10027277_01070 [Pseudoduganella ginsengisoli]|uniref:Uncharacterized protein n=1 Tax=Pseudoduganella ginsengisoli TaxID=1462440 RepID=A0A6L6QAX6_9BURK|nr:hypothetical protein [Pseudoduganella ginsengisoli]MTW06341.1 hypothetical protein [Pseudoduganella ginsengisoli]